MSETSPPFDTSDDRPREDLFGPTVTTPSTPPPASIGGVSDTLLDLVGGLIEEAGESWPQADRELAMAAIADYAMLVNDDSHPDELLHSRAAMRNVKSSAGQSAVNLLNAAVARGMEELRDFLVTTV